MKNFDEQYARYTAGEKKINDLMHRLAQQYGMSDSVLAVFMCLYEDKKAVHTQNSIAIKMGLPKQTINSAITKLMNEEYIYLEQLPVSGNNKQVLLTEKGLAFCAEKVAPFLHAEEQAFERLTEQEQEAFLSIGIKFNQFMVEELMGVMNGRLGENDE